MNTVSPTTLIGDRSSLFPMTCVRNVSATDLVTPSRYMREITTSPFWLMKNRAEIMAPGGLGPAQSQTPAPRPPRRVGEQTVQLVTRLSPPSITSGSAL
eukprot:scaffold98670_cov48-Phaeocystis_antarctica.AAC.3